MPLTGDVRLNQDGLVPTARTLTNAVPLDIAMVDANGDQLTGFNPTRPASATLTSVNVDGISVTLLASNASRRKFAFYNAGNKPVFVAYAATATTSAYTFQIVPAGYYESELNCYTGIITAIAATGTHAVKVTEIS